MGKCRLAASDPRRRAQPRGPTVNPVHNAPMRHDSGCHPVHNIGGSQVHNPPMCTQPRWITTHNVHNAPMRHNSGCHRCAQHRWIKTSDVHTTKMDNNPNVHNPGGSPCTTMRQNGTLCTTPPRETTRSAHTTQRE